MAGIDKTFFKKLLLILKLLAISIAVFVISEITGYIISGFFILAFNIDLFLVLLPIPFHLHLSMFMIASVITFLYFKYLEKNKRNRKIYLVFLLLEYLLIVPLIWLFLTSHGHLDIMFNKIQNLPTALIQANTFIEDGKIVNVPT